MTDVEQPVLEVSDLRTGYGKRLVLDGVSLCVNGAEIVAVIGHNGAGKSTLLKAVFGLLPFWSGTMRLDGREMTRYTSRDLLLAGVVHVAQGNRVFVDLTVKDNLLVGGSVLGDRRLLRHRIDSALAEFPDLRDKLKRRAATLSGGEKQMLALSMALVLEPRLLLLDEPSLGLAPPLVGRALRRIRQMSAERGVAVLIVEQKVKEVLKIAGRVMVVRAGRVSFEGPAEDLRDQERLRQAYL